MTPFDRGRLALALLAGVSASAAPLAAAEVAGRGVLELRPGTAIAVKATEPLVVVAEPVAAGTPVAKGTLLAELDLTSLRRSFEHDQRELEVLRSEQRNGPAERGRGGSTSNPALELEIAQAASDLLDLQSRIAQTAVRAPEDGYVVRFLYQVGAKAKKRKPFLEFGRLADVRLEVTLAAPEAEPFRPGTDVQIRGREETAPRFAGRVESATPRGGEVLLSIRPLELPFLDLGVATDLRLTN